MAFFEIKGLKKSFGSNEVLKGIDLTLEKGEVLSIIGSSGGGKTTLLRSMNFLETPDGGEIWIDGHRVFGMNAEGLPEVDREAQRMMGLVFQQFNLFPQYSVIGNLTLAPKLHAKERADFKQNKKEIYAEIDARAEEILRVTGLSEKRDSYPYQLSGGQQQRVAIARALMLSPKILCFDEPTSALDPELTGEVLKVIRELKNSDRTMVIVTHEIGFAKGVSDKVIFMADGVIEECGTPEEVLENPKSPKTIAFLKNAKD
ncbi:MAG: amino acid ABC transporter ATP-binding protein [Clostridia bacterium]|nr:amino acid ABC transporter ATP-binding protein [Clostridia bacterium]MBQ8269488.1 amino acid ABC transporter ATP-binding protein [Clostridia bacterium]